MDGNDWTAAPWARTWQGQTWWFSPLTLGDWAVLEGRLRRQLRDPLEIAKQRLAGLSADDRRALLEAALVQSAAARSIGIDELLEFSSTPEGMTLVVWLSLRRRHPEITEDEAASLLERWGGEELRRLGADAASLQALPEHAGKN